MIFVLFLLWLFPMQAIEKTVCLNMIVKDESAVIMRCLASVKNMIDYWVIVDTGSKDGTQQIIQEFMKDIPGELHERPWIDFAHNRNEALVLAKDKADYVLFIDADEELYFSENFFLPALDKDFYYIPCQNMGTKYSRAQLIDNHLNWRWEGVVHEAVICPEAKSFGTIDGVVNQISWDGNRSQDPLKYQKDAYILEEALKKDPTNSRYVFYLAQSYRDAGQLQAALRTYVKRIEMGGKDQEVFWSLLEVAKLQDQLQIPFEFVMNSYCKAYQTDSLRAEPLYYLIRKLKMSGNFFLGYTLSKIALSLDVPKDFLFLETWIYEYGLWQEFADCAFWLGKYEEAQEACLKLLANPNTPQELREIVEKNLDTAIMKAKHPPRFEGAFEGYGEQRLKLIAKFLPEDPVIVEAGAHYGSDTIQFAKMWPEATIISFEPNPSAYQKALEATWNIANVQIHNAALGTYNGRAILNVSYGPEGNNPSFFEEASSLLKPSEFMKGAYQGPKVQVPCVILDSWCAKNHVDHIDFLWLDLEGLELQVLQSSPQILTQVKVVYTETNFQEFRKGMTQYNALKEFLEKSGFKLLSHWYSEGFQGDAIFVKKEIFDLGFQDF